METKGFFQFEIIINVLVNSFHFIWNEYLDVMGLHNFYDFLVRGPALDVRFGQSLHWKG